MSQPSLTPRPRTRAARRLELLPLLVLLGCSGSGHAVVVNAGSSVPMEERENPDPFDRLSDRTAIVAWEFGTCERDADCVLTGCNDGMCATAEAPSVCAESPVGACLSQVDPGLCGCVEGVCRWLRTPVVMACARLGDHAPTTRGFDGAEGDDWYPLDPAH